LDYFFFNYVLISSSVHVGSKIVSMAAASGCWRLEARPAVRVAVGGRVSTRCWVQQPRGVAEASRIVVHLNPGNECEQKQYDAGCHLFTGQQVLGFLAELEVNEKDGHF